MESKQIRRANLTRFVTLRLNGNKSELTRMLGNESPSYVNDLLSEKSGKSFGEKAARRIEQKVGLLAGQLDIVDSPLHMDPARAAPPKQALIELIDELTTVEAQELTESAREILGRRKRKTRKSA